MNNEELEVKEESVEALIEDAAKRLTDAYLTADEARKHLEDLTFLKRVLVLLREQLDQPAENNDEDLDEEDDGELDPEDDDELPTWHSYFDRTTLSISFKYEYEDQNGIGALKVEYDESVGSWYFHDTYYCDCGETNIHTSNFLFDQPGQAITAAEEWLAKIS